MTMDAATQPTITGARRETPRRLMSTVQSRPPRPIAIKSARAVVPGCGPEGHRFGTLVPSGEIVAGIRPRRKPRTRGDTAPARPPEDLPASFVRSLLGFEFIATTHTTYEVARAAIESGLDWVGAAGLRVPVHNEDVEAMTTQAVADALDACDERRGRPAARARSIAGHVHIASTSGVRTPYALLESRRATRCDKPGLPIVSLLSGCSGLLFALQQAQSLLEQGDAARDPDAFVVISCHNDLLPFAHTRGRCPADRNESIDDWLFQAIFGEGAGAIVVGHADEGGGDWVVESLDWAAVTDDWRVTMTTEGGAPGMVIRARDVGVTFREHVPTAARRGLDALGLRSFREVHRLCIHESNPNLVAYVASRLEAPPQAVHSICAKVGTLAGVSAFSLLDEALEAHRDGGTSARDAIVCALIGEAGNSVVAGHVALRYAR
jgi:3-oxoacyl-[acyl-carrier-protein] synthase III